MIEGPGIRDVMRDVVEETLALAKASGVVMAPDMLARTYRIADAMPTQFSSTAQDLARGKPTEIDHLNGFVVRRGEALGIPTPANRALHALVAELSRRLRAVNAALEARSTLDLGGRLAGLLMAEQTGRGLVPLSQGELARRLGASREKVNRKLREWSASGWVETTPAGLRILGETRLRALSAGPWSA